LYDPAENGERVASKLTPILMIVEYRGDQSDLPDKAHLQQLCK
jgi:hypothetical protein